MQEAKNQSKSSLEIDKKIEFLYQSISDIQSTIRALDVKLGILFAFTLLPLISIPDIAKIYNIAFYETSNIAAKLACSIVAISWLASFYLMTGALISKSNPREHIPGNLPLGIFYGGDTYNLTLKDIYLNSTVKSGFTLKEDTESLPTNFHELIEELNFERMKLIFIREIKLKRINHSVQLAFTWIISGSIVWFLLCVLSPTKC